MNFTYAVQKTECVKHFRNRVRSAPYQGPFTLSLQVFAIYYIIIRGTMTFGIDGDPRNIPQMLASMNSNIPVNRRSLADYVDNGEYTYETKSGSMVSFDRGGVEYLDSICTPQEKLTLRLPIFVSTDTAAEGSCWKIEGRTEVAVVSRMLDRRVHSDDYLRVYYADLMQLKKLIPDLIFTLFLP